MSSPTIYSFTLVDDAGVKATHKIYVSYDGATETINAIIGNILAYGATLDAVTDCRIEEVRITIPIDPDPSWKAAAIVPSDVERGGLFDFTQENSKYLEPVQVPGYKRSLSPKERIDLTAAAYLAWAAPLLNHVTGIGGSSEVFANSKFSNELDVLRHAAITFRKHRRGLSKVSEESFG
jgi:hypothetical protein